MAIPFNEFEVAFIQTRGEQILSGKVEHFFTNELDFYEKREVVFLEIKENIDVSILFQSPNKNLRLYMDGLDTLSEHLIEVDPEKGEVYLLPSEQSVTLFSNKEEYYPLIPGFYRLVVVADGQSFFSWIKVIPKQLEESQWEIMRDEVEKELMGLAREIVLNRTGMISGVEGITPGMLGQFIVIKNRFPSVMAAISDLYRKVNYRINKDYLLVPKEKCRMIDEKTVRHRGSHPEHEHVLKSPLSAITYDLPENRLVKKIIRSVSQTLTGFMEAVERMENSIHNSHVAGPFRTEAEKRKTLSELQNLNEMARKMRGAIQWIKTSPWYNSVGISQSSVVPYIMNSDPRYRALYQLYRELGDENIQLTMDKSYSYQWKRTDKLYEIWGFIQFIKVLSSQELSFMPEKGWAFSEHFDGNRLILPTLPPQTVVVFRKDSLRVNLVYEALLPTQSKLTNKQNPLFTRGTHTCPDGRLDVYKNELYIGSIIFDLKYRPRYSIWNQNLIYSNKQNGVMRQLVSYGDNLHSPFLFGENIANPFNISPVQEVWAIYPNRYGTDRTFDFPDHKLSLMELTPGGDNSYFAGKVKQAIDKLVQRSEQLIGFLDRIGV